MPEQIFFEDTPAWRGEEEKKPVPIVPEEEPINCQYCQDGDVPCTYCKRGQEKIAEEKNKKSGESIWDQIRRIKRGG